MKGLNRKIKDFTSLLLAVMMVMSVFSPLFVYEVYADNPAPSARQLDRRPAGFQRWQLLRNWR